ncbi:ABC exporter membrane fusion protein [Pantanalinema rosaneae CENA516]|uniref:ABC exporter membrane fusion protein n=1 Tax=Pantanalinema rosaneae TaxID=1620701 RepID=UPI003D6EF6D5
MSLQPVPKLLRHRWIIGLVITATALTGATVIYGMSQLPGSNPPSPAPTAAPTTPKITALGRLEPETDVIQVAAPQALDSDRLAELFVKRGDRVQAGQVIAVLDSRDRLQVALLQAQKQLSVAQAKLAQVQAGAQTGEIEAQQANIARLEAQLQTETIEREAEIARVDAELRNANRTLQRYQDLYQEGAETAVIVDEKRERYETTLAQLNRVQAQRDTTVATLRKQIQQERATLDRIAEVRPVDVRIAQAEVEAAIAALKKAEVDLNQVLIRSPISGRILEIHTRPGETISSNGIVELAETDQMQVVAEVYQTDIGKIRVGQAATITSPSFPGTLFGNVEVIGLQVSRQNVFSDQPGENLDRRVIEVRIRLTTKDSQVVAGLTNLQVQVAIEPNS